MTEHIKKPHGVHQFATFQLENAVLSAGFSCFTTSRDQQAINRGLSGSHGIGQDSIVFSDPRPPRSPNLSFSPP